MNILLTIFLASWLVVGGIQMFKKFGKKIKYVKIIKAKVIYWHKRNNFYVPIVEYYDKNKKEYFKISLEKDYFFGIKPIRMISFSRYVNIWIVLYENQEAESLVSFFMQILFFISSFVLGILLFMQSLGV